MFSSWNLTAGYMYGRVVNLLPFICEECCKQNHQGCRGGTWCDCQHKDSDKTREGAEK